MTMRRRATTIRPKPTRVKEATVSNLSPSHPPSQVASEPPDVLLEHLSVVLPAYNEEENLAEAVGEAIAAAERVSRRQEIIVVDDGSHDATAEIATALAVTDSRVRLIRHEDNRGYGCAVRSGIAAARMDWVLLTDADLQFELRQLTDFVPHTADAQLVVGYRAKRSDSLIRRLNAGGWNALVHLLFRLPVRDVDAAFKLIRRDALDGLDFISTGAAIDTELLAKASRSGARIVELPVIHRPRLAGEPSGANLHVIARAFAEVFKVWRSMHVRRWAPFQPASHPPAA
jgi:glycosyltransferase involved in cell wall biosynthesis